MKLSSIHVIRYLLILATFAPALAHAQIPDVKAPVQAAMQDTSVMVGEWTGSSWSMMPDGSRKTAQMHEKISWKLDQTVLLIEGRGIDENGETDHDALGLLSYDPFPKKYKFETHIAQGLNTSASFEMLEPNTKFRWGYETPAGNIRFTLTFSEDGTKWQEKGEFSPDGKRWFPTMEMNLQKR